MDPVDHVVPDIERADALGQELDAERVAIASRFERLVPPLGAVEERRADRLRRAGVEVVSDRLDGLAHRGGRSFFCGRWRRMSAGHRLTSAA
jgi:hypothetical protein